MRARLLVLSVVVLATALPAGAVIKVELTLANMYDSAKAVATGTIAKLSPDSHVVEIKLNPLLRGEGLGEAVKVQVPAEIKIASAPATSALSAPAAGAAASAAQAPELLARLAAGQPVVIFVGKAKGGSLAVMHLADEWVLAEMMPNNPAAWRALQLHTAKQTFPGTTAGLAAAVMELKSGKGTLLNEVEEKPLHGEPKELAKLSVAKPLSLLAAKLDEAAGLELVVGSADELRMFSGGVGGKFSSLGQAMKTQHPAVVLAAGEVSAGEGKADLLLPGAFVPSGGRPADAIDMSAAKDAPLLAAALIPEGKGDAEALYVTAQGQLLAFGHLGGRKPWPAKPVVTLWKDRPALAAAIGGYGEQGRPAAVVVHKDGIVRYGLDGRSPLADYERLTGHRLDAHHKELAGELKDVRLLRLDVNGDGRDDLLVLANGKALLLVNRGFGVFLVNPDPAPGLLAGLDKLGQFVWAAGDVNGDKHEEVLLLKADGTLLVLANAPPK